MGTIQEFEDGRLANRAKVVIPMGDYILQLDGTYMLFNVSHKDGKPIPKGLQGHWKRPEDFRKAAERVHGPAYSPEGLAQRNPVADAARKIGISPEAIGVRSVKANGND